MSAGVVELADTLDLGSSGATREGSNPFARTTCTHRQERTGAIRRKDLDTGGTLKIIVTAEQPVDGKLTAKVTVPAAEVSAVVKQTYKDIAAKYNFQGFRRGHVPRPVIDGIIGREAVLAQATNEILNDVEPIVLEELDIVPVSRLSYGEEEPALVVEGKDYEVEATCTLRPAPELSSYEGFKIQMPPATATEAEIDLQLKQFSSWQVTYEDIDEARPVAENDIASVNVENIEHAEDLEGANRMIELNGQGIPAELQDALIGMNAGETKDVEWGEGENHVAIKVTINSLKTRVFPEIDDAFAKTLGYDTVEGLRDALKEEIESDKVYSLPRLKEDRVTEAAAQRLELEELPAEYTEQVFQELTQEFLTQLERQHTTLDAWMASRRITMQALLDDLHQQAAIRARQSLALDAIARHLGFEATDQDLLEEFANVNMSDQIEVFRKEGRLPGIRDSIKRNKALNWLVENVEVTEVDEVAERAANDEVAETVDAAEAEPVQTADAALDAEVEAMMAEVVEAASEGADQE